MSIREWERPDFSQSFRGYDRVEVDEYLVSFREYTIQAEDRARAAETSLVQCRRELASSPGTAGISERLAAILQLAHEEAEEVRARARAESEAATDQAERQAARTIHDANQQRDAIQREIDELSAVREELVQRLIELGGQIVDATRRYQGFPPGESPSALADVQLFDAEAVDDELGVDGAPFADPDAETQAFGSSDPAPEHQ
jgi:hypothetical protein